MILFIHQIFFCLLFACVIKVFYICNHYKSISDETDCGKHLALLSGRLPEHDIGAHFMAYYSGETFHYVFCSPSFLFSEIFEYACGG